MHALPRQLRRVAITAVVVAFSMLVVLTALGRMPPNRQSHQVDPSDVPLVAPDKLGGFPRWYGMTRGEIRDAQQLERQYGAAAIEASYLPPGMDPVLASAVRAPTKERLLDGVPYGQRGRVRCSSAGLFIECVRTNQRLTVDVLASKQMDEAVVAELVEDFWASQRLTDLGTPGAPATSPPPPG